MKLDKSDALVVYSAIFSFVNSHRTIDKDTLDHLLDIQSDIQEFLTDDESSCDEEHEGDCCDHDDDDCDEELPEADSYVSTEAASDLSAVIVTAVDGSKIDLEFEDVGDAETVDALLDDGTVILDKISHVRVVNNEILLFDGEEWHPFKVKKFPKAWQKCFPHAATVAFRRDKE
jgi:hypothetical protein